MLGEKRRGLLPERRNICGKVHLWSYICTEEWARWLLWAQLEAFPVMTAQPPTLLSLSPNYDICEASSSGKPNCWSCRKIWFDEVCCWMSDHQHRGRGLTLPWILQWASSSSLCDWTSSAKGRWSGCMCIPRAEPSLWFIFKWCSVFVLALAGTGRDPADDDDDDCLQWSLFLSVRSHLFWEELAMIPYRVD